MASLRLYKKEKLCSTVAIDQLFGRGGLHSSLPKSALAFPIRAIWRSNPRRRSDAPIQFLVSVPKKRLRHAVDRTTMRRRIREAFRLLRHSHPLPEATRIDVVFLYVDSALAPYATVESSVNRLLDKIARHAQSLSRESEDEAPQSAE